MTSGRVLARTERRLDRVLLGTLVAVFTGFAVAYTRITPLGASPDELSHLHYITGIADHIRLPPAGEPERQQPPLYYLLGAIVAKLTGDDARLIRLLSVALGVLTILTVFLVARRLFPMRPYLAVGAAALVALLPEAQYLAGAINDDNLAWLAGAVVVLAGVAVMQSAALTTRLALGAGLAVALAVLAKETVWALALLLLVILAVRFARRIRMVQVAAVVLPTVVLDGWWFVRNAVQFGSPFPPLHPITTQRQVFELALPGSRLRRRDRVEPGRDVRQRRPFCGDLRLRGPAAAEHGRPRRHRTAHHRRVRCGDSFLGRVGCCAARGRDAPSRGDPGRAGAVRSELGHIRSPAAGAVPARRRGGSRAHHRLDDRLAPQGPALDGPHLGNCGAGRGGPAA